jgi:hypothetical protein
MKTFFLAWLFYTCSAPEAIWICIPSAPIKWKSKRSFTIDT